MDKRLNYLGIARRAGFLISGTDAVIASIQAKANQNYKKNGVAKIILIASDASISTKEKIINKCNFYHIDYLDIFKTAEIAEAVGLENPKVIAITNQGIAEQIRKINQKEVD